MDSTLTRAFEGVIGDGGVKELSTAVTPPRGSFIVLVLEPSLVGVELSLGLFLGDGVDEGVMLQIV